MQLKKLKETKKSFKTSYLSCHIGLKLMKRLSGIRAPKSQVAGFWLLVAGFWLINRML
jgi:hypothetical protein